MVGGGEYAIYKYAEALARRGHAVTVCGQFRRAFMGELASLPNLSIRIRGGIQHGFKGAGKLNQLWDVIHTHLLLLPRLKRSVKPDIIIGYQRRSSIKAEMLGRKLGVPVAHIAFEPPTEMSKVLGKTYDNVMKGELAKEWDAVCKAYQSSACLIPLTADAGRAVAAWCGKEVHPPCYAGMEPPVNMPVMSAAESHILYIGRLDSTKNVHDLIDAVALMKQPPPLIIVGSGYDEKELKQRAFDKHVRCEFKGVISDRDKWQLIRSCCFLVFPTSIEGFGMPPGEALSCGKPAICSDIPVLREVYQDAVEYFPLHDAPALAAIMQKLLDDPGYRRSRGEAGRTYVLERYTWEKCAERIEKALGV